MNWSAFLHYNGAKMHPGYTEFKSLIESIGRFACKWQRKQTYRSVDASLGYVNAHHMSQELPAQSLTLFGIICIIINDESCQCLVVNKKCGLIELVIGFVFGVPGSGYCQMFTFTFHLKGRFPHLVCTYFRHHLSSTHSLLDTILIQNLHMIHRQTTCLLEIWWKSWELVERIKLILSKWWCWWWWCST